MGHVGLGAYLNRFNMKDSNLCKECKVSETVDYFLLRCRMYAEEMVQRLRKSDIFDLNLKILLGGSQEHNKKRRAIFAALAAYLSASGRLNDL